jgi:hypothetical protein
MHTVEPGSKATALFHIPRAHLLDLMRALLPKVEKVSLCPWEDTMESPIVFIGSQ